MNWTFGWLAGYRPATIRPHPLRGPNVAKEPGTLKDISGLSFEDALKELEAIVQQLEQGKVKLDEAITEEGKMLV